MVSYNCDKCGKIFSQKSHYKSHTERRSPCSPDSSKLNEVILELKCLKNEMRNIVKLLKNHQCYNCFKCHGKRDIILIKKSKRKRKKKDKKMEQIKPNIVMEVEKKIEEKLEETLKIKSEKKLQQLIDEIYKGANNPSEVKPIIEDKLVTSSSELFDYSEVSTPFKLVDNILSKLDSSFWLKSPKILDHTCGKGNIILSVFDCYYTHIQTIIPDPIKACKHIIEECLYFCDINPLNVFITKTLLTKHAQLYTKTEIAYSFNTYVGNSLELDCMRDFSIPGFDAVVVNPPFEDKRNRKKTQHKLWIDFTKKAFNDLLVEDGLLAQISPFSFSSPSSKILKIFQNKTVLHIFFDQEEFFPKVNTTICWYIIENSDYKGNKTNINDKYQINIDKEMLYIPKNFSNDSYNIHRKVMFLPKEKCKVERDYVTAHNIILKREKDDPSLSKTKTDKHIYPVFHTNRQVWYSKILQPFATKNKVMWTRSGYTKPFFDEGTMGVTDMGYYILVPNKKAGKNLKKKKFLFFLFC